MHHTAQMMSKEDIDNDFIIAGKIGMAFMKAGHELKGEQTVRLEYKVITIDLETGKEKVREMWSDCSKGQEMLQQIKSK